MTLSTKFLAILGSILLLGGLALVFYEVHAVHVRQDAIEQQVITQKQLADNITRAMAQWATKADLEQLAKDSNTNLDAIKKDLASLNSSLTAINVVTAHSNGQSGNNLPSTNVIKNPDDPATPAVLCNGEPISCPNQDPHGYQGTTQELALDEDFGTLKVPFGKVGFSASQEKPWSVNVSPREYKVTTVLGTDENQRITAYNKVAINVDNKEYGVPITTSEIKQEYPSAKFTLFNPRLYLGFDAGVKVSSLPIQGAVGPNVSVQLSSYGRYKNQPDFSIAQVGVAYDIPSKNPDFLLKPISYNIGQHLPLMNNLYVGPALHVNTSGDVAVTLGIGAGL